MKKFNAAVIGLGRIGMMYSFDAKRKQPASHVSAILKNPRLNLVGVCDLDKSLRKLFKKKFGIFVTKTHKDLIRVCKNSKIDLDIVVIATPEKTHYKILDDCIKELKNYGAKTIIFCEKPLTNNLRSARKIKKLVNKTKINLVVNHSRRWSKVWQEAYLFSKKLNSIEKASFYFSTSPENENFSQIRDGIHIADIMSWFDIKTRTAVNRLNVPFFLYDFHLWGNNGKIEILNFGKILNLYRIVKSVNFKGFKELKLIKSKKFDESYLVNAYAEFVRFLDNRGKLITQIDDAVEAIKTFEECIYDRKLPK